MKIYHIAAYMMAISVSCIMAAGCGEGCEVCGSNNQCGKCREKYGSTGQFACHLCTLPGCSNCPIFPSTCTACLQNFALSNEKNVIKCINLDPMYFLLRIIMVILIFTTSFLCCAFILINYVKSMRKKKEFSKEEKVNMESISSRDAEIKRNIMMDDDESIHEQEKNFFEMNDQSMNNSSNLKL